MIGGTNKKILVNLNENGILSMDDNFTSLFGSQPDPKYKLVRERDKLTKTSVSIKWLEFDETGKFKASFEEIAVGRSLIMSPFNEGFTWQTTPVTKIIKQDIDCIIFKTENSTYKLYKL